MVSTDGLTAKKKRVGYHWMFYAEQKTKPLDRGLFEARCVAARLGSPVGITS